MRDYSRIWASEDPYSRMFHTVILFISLIPLKFKVVLDIFPAKCNQNVILSCT